MSFASATPCETNWLLEPNLLPQLSWQSASLVRMRSKQFEGAAKRWKHREFSFWKMRKNRVLSFILGFLPAGVQKKI